MSDNFTNALPPGSTLRSSHSSYTIDSTIGAGGFGITYKASSRVTIGNIRTTAPFAIKEFFIAADCERTRLASGDSTMRTSGPASTRVSAAKRDFISEARRLYDLAGNSRNIVSVNEVFEANGTAYYVMEYLDGPSLRDYIRSRGRLTEAETLDLMLPIVSAVSFLHSRKITHHDIKPANIVLAYDDEGSAPRPVLIDFGQSRHYDEKGAVTCTVSAAGLSEGYAPIEQYAGVAQFSPSTDVYALGATMLHCLSGQKPPRAVDMTPEYIDSVLPASTSPSVRAAIHRAMAFRADERTASASDFYGQLTGKIPVDYTTGYDADNTLINDNTVVSDKTVVNNRAATSKSSAKPKAAKTKTTTPKATTPKATKPKATKPRTARPTTPKNINGTQFDPNNPIGPVNPLEEKIEPKTPVSAWIIIGLLVAAIITSVALLISGNDRQEAPVVVPDDTVAVILPATDVPAEEEAAEEAAPAQEEVRSGTPPPVMHTYNFNGYFSDASGQRWPVKLKATTDGQGRWGSCVYTNVTYNVVLNMQGSGSDDRYSFYSNEKGADLSIDIGYEGEGVWSGTASSGRKTLSVTLYE